LGPTGRNIKDQVLNGLSREEHMSSTGEKLLKKIKG
jgi:hypothetical protein